MSERNIDHYQLPPVSPESPTVKRETKMRRAFYAEAQKIQARENEFLKTDNSVRIGLEIECSVLTPDYTQATEADRDAIKKAHPDFTDSELGAAQLEWRTDPIDISGFGLKELDAQLTERQKILVATAKGLGVQLLNSGSNPFVDVSDIKRTTATKYVQVPNYHNDNKRAGLKTVIGILEKVDVADAAIVGLSNSVQCNLEAKGFADAIDKLNRSFAIGPMATALGANSRLLEGKDTGLADTRMIAWEISHDTRTLRETEEGKITRVGLPGIYYTDMQDYFQRLAAQPFIIEVPEDVIPNAAFPIGIGLNWRDTRIKFTDNSVLVEFRPVSVQSTPKENIAMMLFWLGRLAYSQQTNEPLLDMKKVKENRDNAMALGMAGQLWTFTDANELIQLPAYEALNLELARAEIGLMKSGVDVNDSKSYISILLDRVNTKTPPAKKTADCFKKYSEEGFPRREALVLALNEVGALL